MSLSVKLGVGALTLGSAVGAGYAGVSYFSKEDKKEVNNTLQQGTAISKLIEEEYKFKLLDTSEGSGNKDESHWTTNWRAYKSANINQERDLFGLKGWNKTNPGDSSLALKKKCGELATKEVSSRDENLYQNVTTYCGRSVTVHDEATKNQLTVLDTDSTDKDSKVWESRQSKSTDLKSDLNKLGINQSNPTKENIKTGCNAARTKNKKEEGVRYQETYTAYVKVCTRQPEDPTN